MPIYEYKCKDCEKTYEKFYTTISEAEKSPLDNCPDCQGELEKMISQSTFKLKGTGWYETDYGTKKSQKEEKEYTKPEPTKPEKTNKT